MKIVIATPLFPPEIGGPATYSASAARMLPPLGFEIRLLKFSTVRKEPRFISPLHYGWLVFKAARRADIVYALDPVSVGGPARFAACLARRPLVVRIAGDYAWEQGVQRFGVTATLDDFAGQTRNFPWPVRCLKFIQKWVTGGARAVIVPSFYFQSIVAKWGVAPDKIKVIYSAFESPAKTYEHFQCRQALHLDGLVIVSAARLVPWKGLAELVTAAAKLKSILPEISLYIAGDGPERDRLERHIAKLGAGGFVFLLGSLPQDELFTYIAAADLFVLNTAYEGLSHQLLEAIALGTPIITTAVGGNPEVIVTGESGILIESGRPDQLEAAILWLAKRAADRTRLAREAETCLKKFSVETMLADLSATLKVVCAS